MVVLVVMNEMNRHAYLPLCIKRSLILNDFCVFFIWCCSKSMYLYNTKVGKDMTMGTCDMLLSVLRMGPEEIHSIVPHIDVDHTAAMRAMEVRPWDLDMLPEYAKKVREKGYSIPFHSPIYCQLNVDSVQPLPLTSWLQTHNQPISPDMTIENSWCLFHTISSLIITITTSAI